MSEDKPDKSESTEIQNPFSPPEPPQHVDTARKLSDEEAGEVVGGTLADLGTVRSIVVEMKPVAPSRPEILQPSNPVIPKP